jgi:hypothetical protein
MLHNIRKKKTDQNIFFYRFVIFSRDFDLDKLKELIDESKILKHRASLPDYQAVYMDTQKTLMSIIHNRNHEFINIFRLGDDKDSQDIELAILRAMLNGKSIFK